MSKIVNEVIKAIDEINWHSFDEVEIEQGTRELEHALDNGDEKFINDLAEELIESGYEDLAKELRKENAR